MVHGVLSVSALLGLVAGCAHGPTAVQSPVLRLGGAEYEAAVLEFRPADPGAGYIIQRKNGDGEWRAAGEVPPGVGTFRDRYLVPGTGYSYRLVRTAETGTQAIRGGENAVPFSVNLDRVVRVILVATDAGDGNGNDHAIWGEPVLIKRDGTRVALASLKPDYFRVGWGEAGEPRTIGIGGKEYPNSIWAHAPSEMAYELDGKYARLEAFVGVDTGQGQRGSVVFKARAVFDDPSGEVRVKTPGLDDSPGRTAYHIDSVSGDDAADGTSPATPWKSLKRVNATRFAPGDLILFKSGSRFTGQLRPHGSGQAGLPIRIDRYSEGPLPVIDMGEAGGAVLSLVDQDQWEIRHLELAGGARRPNEARQGVCVEGSKARRILRHIVVSGCVIRDIWGSPKAYHSCAIWVGVPGWANPDGAETGFDDVLIEGNEVRGADRCGILVWTCAGPYFEQFLRQGNPPLKWQDLIASTNVIVRGNRLTELGGDGILVLGSNAPLIERNYVRRSCLRTGEPGLGSDYNQASAAIWVHDCSRAIMQFNEVHDTGKQPGNNDGMAYDFDFSCDDGLLQYNYSRNNAGGFLLMMNDVKRNAIRYNVSENDGPPYIIMHCRPEDGNMVYNNVFHVTAGVVPVSGRAIFTNNIFHAAGDGRFALRAPVVPGMFRRNCFYGPWDGELPDDPEKMTADPQMVAPGTGKEGLDSLAGYRLRGGSPCRGAGVPMDNDGGRDFWGSPLKAGAARNIGPDQGKKASSRPGEGPKRGEKEAH